MSRINSLIIFTLSGFILLFLSVWLENIAFLLIGTILILIGIRLYYSIKSDRDKLQGMGANDND